MELFRAELALNNTDTRMFHVRFDEKVGQYVSYVIAHDSGSEDVLISYMYFPAFSQAIEDSSNRIKRYGKNIIWNDKT